MLKFKLVLLACLPLLVAAGPPSDLRLKAIALDAIYQMNLSPDQLHTLSKLAAGAAEKPANPPPRLGQNLHKALVDLCDALAKGEDAKVSELQDKVDELEEQSKLDDATVEPTEAGRKHSADLIKMLTPGEIVSFIAAHSDEIEGPAETLIESFDDLHADSDDDFNDDLPDTVREVVELAKGFDGDKKLADDVTDLLTKMHKLSDADFKSQRAALEQQAHTICGQLDSFMVIKHWTQEQFAELISNPELPSAIDMRLKNHVAAPEKN